MDYVVWILMMIGTVAVMTVVVIWLFRLIKWLVDLLINFKKYVEKIIKDSSQR